MAADPPRGTTAAPFPAAGAKITALPILLFNLFPFHPSPSPAHAEKLDMEGAGGVK